jgi:hypothetical protein
MKSELHHLLSLCFYSGQRGIILQLKKVNTNIIHLIFKPILATTLEPIRGMEFLTQPQSFQGVWPELPDENVKDPQPLGLLAGSAE